MNLIKHVFNKHVRTVSSVSKENSEELIYNRSDSSPILDCALYDEDMYFEENEDGMDFKKSNNDPNYGPKSIELNILFSQRVK